MIATTCEQSARLLACGVDPKTADMMWDRLDENRDYLLLSASWETNRIKNRKITDNTIPAWSLSALLMLVLPRKIQAKKEYLNYTLNLHPYFMGGWQIKYSYREYDECYNLLREYSDTPIEACVKAVEWLTENDYKLNTNQQ